MDVPVNDSLGGDLELKEGSPAIDMGNNTANAALTDILGNPRITDGNGNGTATIDIGAYERRALTVSNTDDDGPSSLRDIVRAARPGDTISFSPMIDGDTIKLISGEITLDTNLVIIGNGINNTIIDGQDSSRIFHITAGDTVSINDVTLQHGNGEGFRLPFSFGTTGGAILNQGQLCINNASISGSFAFSGGGIANTKSSASISLNNTSISGNTSFAGGGIFNGDLTIMTLTNLSLIHISEPTRLRRSRMPSSA